MYFTCYIVCGYLSDYQYCTVLWLANNSVHNNHTFDASLRSLSVIEILGVLHLIAYTHNMTDHIVHKVGISGHAPRKILDFLDLLFVTLTSKLLTNR